MYQYAKIYNSGLMDVLLWHEYPGIFKMWVVENPVKFQTLMHKCLWLDVLASKFIWRNNIFIHLKYQVFDSIRVTAVTEQFRCLGFNTLNTNSAVLCH